MNQQNESYISPRWAGFKKFWLAIAILLFLILALLWLLGYGPNGKNCQIPPKIVEVEKLIDNPEQLKRIGILEIENGAITGLKARITELENVEPKVVEKIMEKLVDNPEHLKRIGILETENSLLSGLRAKIKAFESAEPKVVEKLIDNPEQLKRIGILETENALLAGLKAKIKAFESAEPKVVETLIDNPEQLKRIDTLEKENALIAGLQTKIKELENAEPKVVEKIVDNPEQLKRIGILEAENALIAGLHTKINELENTEPKVVEKIVEKIVTKKVFETRLFFRSGSYFVPSNSQLYLSPTINYLKSHPNAKVSVKGFHDESGILTANQLLASQRAQMVTKQLIRSGISTDRIVVSQPSISAGTGLPAEARRVEVNVID